MRKIVVFNRITVDGFFAGPNGEIDWFIHDPEVNKASHRMMKPDTILFGRVTFELFESYWPNVINDPSAHEEVRALAKELTQMTKIVFSKTRGGAHWENSQIVQGNVVETVRALKQGDGADITIFGSGTIVQQLADAGLIDEYLLALSPTVLGEGKPLFAGMKKLNLELIESMDFDTGHVLLRYKQL